MADFISVSTGKIIALAPSLVPLGDMKISLGEQPTMSEYKSWYLTGEAVWYDKELGVIRVPKGFITDFASIPAAFRWWQTGGVGPQRIAAYFHDYMYSEQLYSRKHADRVFRSVMEATKPVGGKLRNLRSWARRWIMWGALRGFGVLAWIGNGKNLEKLGTGWRVMKEETPDNGQLQMDMR